MKLLGKLLISGQIHVLTGLHIGGSKTDVPIGGIENSVIVNAAGVPFIPGSSIKGKLRSLLEKVKGAELVCNCGKCYVCAIFGTGMKKGGPKNNPHKGPTRLFVRDAFLNDDIKKLMLGEVDDQNNQFSNLEFTYTESKWENVIDRKYGRAENPRQVERVPAGAIFNFNMVYNIFDKEDLENLKHLLLALNMLADDYLGGNGSRGYGQIAFEEISVGLKTIATYESQATPEPIYVEVSLDEITYEELSKRVDELIYTTNGAENNG